MKRTLWIFMIVFFFIGNLDEVSGQKPDIRTHTEYQHAEDKLKLKFEFYHDFWSERDVCHGRYSEWAGGDRMVLDCFYRHGKRDSVMKVWYPNGDMKEISWWSDDQRHGKSQFFDRKGKILKEVDYSNGLMSGLYMTYYPSGKVKNINQYRNGEQHGSSTSFSKKGVKKSVVVYLEGTKVKAEREKSAKQKDEAETESNPKEFEVDSAKSQDAKMQGRRKWTKDRKHTESTNKEPSQGAKVTKAGKE